MRPDGGRIGVDKDAEEEDALKDKVEDRSAEARNLSESGGCDNVGTVTK